jgi:nickel-dependent lactate racemase
MPTVGIRTASWCGDREHTLAFPDDWELLVLEDSAPVGLDRGEIERRIRNPVAGPSLAQLFAPGKSVAIVIDDHTRPAPMHDALAVVVDEARRAGIPVSSIRIVVALGTHVLDRKEMLAGKLGSLMEQGIEIVLPDCSSDRELRTIGTAPRGFPVEINRHVADADVRISINGVYPHDDVGFSGGAKIMIGVLGIRTIHALHSAHGRVVRGTVLETAFRTELEAVADLVGLHYSVNLVVNRSKQIVAVGAGEFRAAFREAAREAGRFLGVEIPAPVDVVVSNAYPFDTSLSVVGKGLWPFHHCRTARFRILVASLCDCSDARVSFPVSPAQERRSRLKRALFLSQGKALVGGLARRAEVSLRGPWSQDYVVYVPFVERESRGKPWMIGRGRAFYSWPELMGSLAKAMPAGRRPRVAVFPSAPLLYPTTAGAGREAAASATSPGLGSE